MYVTHYAYTLPYTLDWTSIVHAQPHARIYIYIQYIYIIYAQPHAHIYRYIPSKTHLDDVPVLGVRDEELVEVPHPDPRGQPLGIGEAGVDVPQLGSVVVG